MNKTQKQVESTKLKIEKISAKFDLADSLVGSDISDVLETEVKEISDNQKEYHPIDVMSIKQMADDFKFSRETLEECITNGRAVLERATQDLLLETDNKSGHTMAFAELTTAVLSGVKTHSNLYKEFSATLLNIKKINASGTPQTVTQNLNITENISPIELIERLKKVQ